MTAAKSAASDDVTTAVPVAMDAVRISSHVKRGVTAATVANAADSNAAVMGVTINA